MGVYEMNTESYLQDVRRSAERETYDDGLMEIVIGVLLFIAALATGRPAFIWTYLVALLVLGPGLTRLKARFTFPRIGYVQMPDGDPGRLRKGVVTWVLGVFFLSAVSLPTILLGGVRLPRLADYCFPVDFYIWRSDHSLGVITCW